MGEVVVEVPLKAQTTRPPPPDPHGPQAARTAITSCPQLLDKVVREYTPEGDVVWEVKTPDMPFTAIRLPDGNTLIGCTLGNLVIEVDPRGQDGLAVSNDDLPGKPINDACGVQRLPDGNTVITSYRAHGGEVKLMEVTPDRKLVWAYRDDSPHGIHHVPDPRHQRPGDRGNSPALRV